MIDASALLKKHLAKYCSLDKETFDITWDFINSNYTYLSRSLKNNTQDILQSIPFSFASRDFEQIKTIFVFASGIKEAELTGSIQDIKRLQQIIEQQSKAFRVLEEENRKIKQILNDFRKEMKEIITNKQSHNFLHTSESSQYFHNPYHITLKQYKAKKDELVIHTGRGKTIIELTQRQFELISALAKKSIEDKNLPYDQQGWLSCDEIKKRVDGWDHSTDNRQIRSQIATIRKELDNKKLYQYFIECVDNVGYRLGTYPERITI